ncbi:hypothetical protein N7454_010479 [Penicillium verhagenii]|nr:hypothetical protein N7454_010479 [Penicillium verhagenii]
MHFHSFITLSLMSTAYALSIPGSGAQDMPILEPGPVIAPASGAYKAPRAYSHASASVTPHRSLLHHTLIDSPRLCAL